METIIETKELTKIYNPQTTHKVVALKNISMSIQQGSFVSIMGKSGSGKTTLINILSTIDEPTSGHVYLLGQDTYLMSEKQKAEFRKEKIGFVFQDFNLMDFLDVKENIILGLRLNKINIKDKEKDIQEIVDELDIKDILDKYPFECSGGQKQRIAIARALVEQPSIIFCDEPTGNLDSYRSKQLMEYFTGINKKYHITIVMVTHDCLVSSYSQEMYYVEDGIIKNHIYRGEDSFEEYYSRIAQISMGITL